MKLTLFLPFALLLSNTLFGGSAPQRNTDAFAGVGIERQNIRLPIKFANYRELYGFIAHHSIGGAVAPETIFKLAADSETEIYAFDDPPRYL